MNAAEAARLLGHAAAFDNRTVGEAGARAWATALHDVPLDQDTLDAVAAFYGTNTLDATTRFDATKRRWIEPHHVRYHRQQIRNARITSANALYAGNPDETPIESIRNRRALITAAASGQLPPQNVRLALTSGDPIDATGRGRDMLRAIGRESPSRRPEFTAACPHCHAPTGQPCTNGHGHRRRDAHPTRIEASRALAAGEPPVDSQTVAAETARRRAASAAALAQQPPTDERETETP